MTDTSTPCPTCKGTGKRYIQGNMDKDWREIDCLECRGTGQALAEAPHKPPYGDAGFPVIAEAPTLQPLDTSGLIPL